MAMPVRIVLCANCGEVKRHTAKGLCKICYNYLAQTGEHRRPGVGGCNPDCFKWAECRAGQRDGYTGPLPCEVLCYTDEDPALYEASPEHVRQPISIELVYKLNVE